jgi:hypothetical protein
MAREDPDERAFRRHLSAARFQSGVDRGDWRLVKDDWTWPHPIIAVAAAPRPDSPDELALRFTVDGYPALAPTAAPWHSRRDEPLPRELWPTGGRVSPAFNPSWRVDAVYIPCDRLAIAGHDPWLQQHTAYLWDAGKDIVDYLRVIYDLLHSPGYTGVRRTA